MIDLDDKVRPFRRLPLNPFRLEVFRSLEGDFYRRYTGEKYEIIKGDARGEMLTFSSYDPEEGRWTGALSLVGSPKACGALEEIFREKKKLRDERYAAALWYDGNQARLFPRN